MHIVESSIPLEKVTDLIAVHLHNIGYAYGNEEVVDVTLGSFNPATRTFPLSFTTRELLPEGGELLKNAEMA